MLIAHWPLEGNPKDEAYGNYNGTEIGGVSYGDGILGDCYDNTSGSGTGIQIMEHADAEKFENVFSWSLWFKSTTTSGGTVRRILARDDSEYPTFTIDQNQSGQQDLESDAAGSAQVNEWHHAAFVHQSDQTVITYIDGVRQGTRSAPKTSAARPWVIGGNTEGDGDISGGHFVGKIDDVRFYDHLLSKAEVKELAQGKVGHWDFEDLGEIETFDEQRSGLGWDVTNAFIQNTSKIGKYSIGSWGNGETRMAWEPKGLEGGKQIQSFSYWWQEDSSQTGHAVRLFDSSGNEVQESGTENPQWYLNDGSGRYQEYGGDNYNVWTLFSFSFDWSAGTYDFYLRDSQSGTTRTGTNNLQNATNVERIEFNGDGYGSADYNRFDGISFAYQTAKDSTIQKNNGSVQGDLQIRRGKVGEHSARFDGVDDKIALPDILQSPAPKTISAWVNTNDVTKSQRPVSLRGSARILPFWIAESSNGQVSVWQSGTYYSNVTSISENTWTHFALSDDGSNFQLYKNGVQVTSQSSTPQVGGSGDGIGYDPPGVGNGYADYLDGEIDDVRVYASALSQFQVQSIYQARARLTGNHRFFNQSIQESGHRGRFADYTVWNIGTTGSQGDFSQNGSTSENEIVRGTGPHGKFSALWKCIPDSGDDADGGWNLGFQGDNSTRLRMATFVRRNNSTNGQTYHGCDNNGNTLNLDGSKNGNPYFWTGTPPNLDEWYLMVGIVHPNSYQGGQSGISGLYDMDGNQVDGGTDYKWGTGNSQELRDYLFYCTNTSERQYFAYPRVEVMDGTEPSIEALLEGVDAKSEDYTQKLQDAEKPVGMSVQSDRTVISSMNEVGPFANYLLAWWKLNGNTKDFAGGYDATNNGAAIRDGVGQTAYFFDGSDYIRAPQDPYAPALDENSNSLTLSGWIRPTALNTNSTNHSIQNCWLAHSSSSFNDNMELGVDASTNDIQVYFDTNGSDSTNASTGVTVPLDTWTHVIVTLNLGDPPTMKIYKNGNLQLTDTSTWSATNGTLDEAGAELTIGASRSFREPFTGFIQDIRIYEKDMTDEQAAVLYEMSTSDVKMKKRPRGLYAPQFSETDL